MAEHFRERFIDTSDPDNVEIFALASTSYGDWVAEEVGPGIHVVHNLLLPNELEYLNNLCRTATNEDWERNFNERFAGVDITKFTEEELYIYENERKYWFDKAMLIPDRDLCEELTERVSHFFGSGYDVPVISDVHRQKIGEGMDEHSDMGYQTTLLRSVLFYLNDDYEGGELYFPALDFEYKPQAGDFITFPSYDKYTHGVKPVISGSHRYVLAGFAWQAGEHENRSFQLKK